MDGRKLSSYKIYDGATVNLVVRPHGRAAQDIGSDIIKLYLGLLDPKYDTSEIRRRYIIHKLKGNLIQGLVALESAIETLNKF